MLYNPDAYKEPSFSDMADFCESMPADKPYVWENSEGCACAQYSHTKGMKGSNWISTMRADHNIWGQLNQVACDFPRKFGPLAQRLRAMEDA